MNRAITTKGKKWIIVVHICPDLDAIAGIWLLKKFGEEKFPGIAKAKVMFVKNNDEIPVGDNVMAVDVGGGMFDHHPQDQHPGDCATTLIAKYLEIDEEPALDKILNFVANNDLHGNTQPFDLADIINSMRDQPDQAEEIIAWATKVLEAKYRQQMNFFHRTSKEYKEKARVNEIIIDDGRGERVLRVVTIESDDKSIFKYARSIFGGEAAVIIQKESSGSVQIHTNRRSGLKLHDVAQLIRLEEQKAKGRIETKNWYALSGEGKVAGAEEWYYHKGLEALMNGSFKVPKIPPTKLSLEKITGLVMLGIHYTFLPNKICRDGGSCIFNNCSFYEYGLARCRKLRFEPISKP